METVLEGIDEDHTGAVTGTMTTTTTTIETTILQERLDKVRKEIRKATQEAWKKAGGGNTTNSNSSISNKSSNNNENQINNRSTTTTKVDVKDHNASFMLGMELFGRNTADSVEMEHSIREKLTDVEDELSKLQQQQQDMMMMTRNDTSTELDDNIENDTTTNPNSRFSTSTLTSDELERQIRTYQAKVSFLKHASTARAYIQESTTLVSSAITNDPDWIKASTKLLDALRSIDDATAIIDRQEEQQEEDHHQQQQPSKEVLVAYQILKDLRDQVRRRRVDLQQKSVAVIEGSVIEMTSNSITVQSSERLMVAYQVLENLYQRPPPSSSSSETTTTQSPPPPILDDVVRRMTRRLYQTIFRPLIIGTTTTTVTSNKDDSAFVSAMAGWTVEQSSDKRVRIAGVSQTQNRGTNHIIEWEVKKHSNNSNSSNSEQQQQDNDDPLVGWKNLIDLMQEIFSFVQSKVLLERESLCQMVGTRLFGRPNAARNDLGFDGLSLEEFGLDATLLGEGDNGVVMEGLVKWLENHCLSKMTPISSSNDIQRIMSFQKDLVSLTIPFCKDMVLRHLMSRDPPPKLVTFSKNFSTEVVNHRRRTLLNEARILLTQNDYHNTVVVGVEEQRDGEAEEYNKKELEIFDLPKCSVSDTANKLISLVVQTMDESVAVCHAYSATDELDTDDPSVASLGLLRPTLYKTAREMFSLYRAIIPSSHRREVSNVPRTAAVLHNDCVFLANHCLTLGLEYKEKFPAVDDDDSRGKLLKQTCVFVDMVPLFRELADTSLGDMLDLQKRQLLEIVGNRITYFGQSLRSNESLHEWSEAETALAAGVYHLRHLSQGWNPILAYSVFLRSMGYLTDVLVTLYLDQTSAATSISPSARYFASALFQKAVADLSDLLHTPKPAKYIPEWGRFVAVGKFLEINRIIDLEMALSSGVFRELGAQELSRLIQAGFPDSSERHALLNGLASMS